MVFSLGHSVIYGGKPENCEQLIPEKKLFDSNGYSVYGYWYESEFIYRTTSVMPLKNWWKKISKFVQICSKQLKCCL